MLTDVVLPLKPWTVVTALLIHCCLAVTQTPNYCARFEFPDLPHLALTAPEGSLVNVSFRLVFNTSSTSSHPTTPTTTTHSNNDGDDKVNCLDRQNIVMGVSKGNSTHQEPECFLRVSTTNEGLCQSFNNLRCRCTVRSRAPVGQGDSGAVAGGGVGGGGRTLWITLQLTQRVGKGDGGWWRWWTRDDVAPPASVFFWVSDKEPEDKEEDKNRQSNSNAREVTEPQHPSTISPGITLEEAVNITSPTPNHDNSNTSSSDNNKNPNAEVEEDEKNKNDDGDDDDGTTTADASAMNVSYVGAIVAGVNISTVFVIGVVVLIVKRVCCKHGRKRGEQPPRPCSLNTVLTEQRRRTMSSTAEYSKPSYEKRVSTASWIYDEIPDDATKTLITTESSLYLHPIECTTTTTTPATTSATTTITFSK